MTQRRRDVLKVAAAAVGGGVLTWAATGYSTRNDTGPSTSHQMNESEIESASGVHYVDPDDGIDGIQDVIDDHAPNVTIRLGSGDYWGEELTLDDGVQLVGNGRNATRLVLDDGANTDLAVTPDPDEQACMQAQFRDITFYGNKANNSSGDLVYGAFWNGRFVDCDFIAAPNNAFWLAGSSNASTDDNYFRGCRFVSAVRHGVRVGLNRDAGPAVGVTRLENCWFGENGGRGVIFRGNANIVANGKFYGNRGSDVQIDRGDRNQVVQSDLSKVDPTGPCIEVLAEQGVDSTGNQISGNVIFGSFRDAVYCNANGNDMVALQVHDNTIMARDGGSERNRSGVFAEGDSYVACSARDNTFTGDFTDSALRIPSSWATSGNVVE